MRRAKSERSGDRVIRFDRVQRATHWATAFLFFVLAFTGAVLYVPALSGAVGHRLVIEEVHVFAGIAILLPLTIAVSGPWGRGFRRDLASMNRFSKGEVAWLRSRGKRGQEQVGKFNPGQKLNTFAVGALLLVLLATGLILRWGNFLAVSVRTGATFVHDWFALGVAVLIAGHILMAIAHPTALRSMVLGWVSRTWASRHAPAWRVPHRLVNEAPGNGREGRAGSRRGGARALR
jgi:formate dehydrogenase subunit gamma